MFRLMNEGREQVGQVIGVAELDGAWHKMDSLAIHSQVSVARYSCDGCPGVSPPG